MTSLSLVTTTVTHNYIVKRNIAKKEIDPFQIFVHINKHVGLDDICGGPVASPIIGWLSRSDYLAKRFNRATFYMNRKCSIYADFAFDSSRQSREVLAIKVTDIKKEAYEDTVNPYQFIMDKLKTYPKKGHTKIESTPDAILITSDVLFEGERHHILHYMGGHRIRYT